MWKQTTKYEINAFFAVWILSATKRDKHLSTKHVWQSYFGQFLTSLHKLWWIFLPTELSWIRWEGKDKKENPSTYIRELWDLNRWAAFGISWALAFQDVHPQYKLQVWNKNCDDMWCSNKICGRGQSISRKRRRQMVCQLLNSL